MLALHMAWPPTGGGRKGEGAVFFRPRPRGGQAPFGLEFRTTKCISEAPAPGLLPPSPPNTSSSAQGRPCPLELRDFSPVMEWGGLATGPLEHLVWGFLQASLVPRVFGGLCPATWAPSWEGTGPRGKGLEREASGLGALLGRDPEGHTTHLGGARLQSPTAPSPGPRTHGRWNPEKQQGISSGP